MFLLYFTKKSNKNRGYVTLKAVFPFLRQYFSLTQRKTPPHPFLVTMLGVWFSVRRKPDAILKCKMVETRKAEIKYLNSKKCSWIAFVFFEVQYRH